LIEGIMQGRGSRHAAFSVSGSGSLVYVLGNGMAEGALVWVHRTGEVEPLLTPPRRFNSARLSPDGQRIALGIEFDIWVYDIARDTLTRLTFEGTNNAPVWTSDGERITYRYAGSASAEAQIRWKLVDGSGGEEILVSDERIYEADSWSADGTVLTFTNVESETGPDIWTLTMEENREPRPFLQTPFAETSPMISPDARWMAYVSNESGRPAVYVQPFPGPGGKWQISTDGGVNPMWSRNGRELFYESGDELMVADITTRPAFAAGSPTVLFAGMGQYRQGVTRARYDVSADGQRFLMMKEGGGSGQTTVPPQIVVIQNWQEELKRLVPTN
jgi:serine/threonine-protein kinase